MIYVINSRCRNFENLLRREEVLALLLSAVGHDLNHPGVNNALLVNSRHPLAVLYNDISVL